MASGRRCLSIRDSTLDPKSPQREGIQLASMKDVADLAGVSVSTVSRVISGKTPVNVATASRVKQAINRLGFRPNLLAAGLRNKSGRFIGLVVPSTDEPFATMISVIEVETRCADFSLLLANSSSDLTIEQMFIESLVRRHADGVIFSVVSEESKAAESLSKSGIPVVMFGRIGRSHRNIVTVGLDNHEAGRQAARLLVESGHRRVGTLTGPLSVQLTNDRLIGFKEELKLHGIHLRDEDIYNGDFSFKSGVEQAKRLVDVSLGNVTAIWAQSDLMAIGLMRELANRGVRVPDDLSIAGMDDIPFAHMTVPALSTIRQPIPEMCRRAVQSIVTYGGPGQHATGDFLFSPEIVTRESVRAIA